MTTAAQAFPWLQVATTVIGSGVLAASVTAMISGWAASRARERQARDTALRAASAFEAFARGASQTASSAQTFDRHDDYGAPLASIPDAPTIENLDWTNVDHRLAARAFGFEQAVHMAEGYVGATFEHDDDAGVDELLEQSLRLGLMAWSIGADLRREYRLPPGVSGIGDTDFVRWMRDETERRTRRREENEAAARELFGDEP